MDLEHLQEATLGLTCAITDLLEGIDRISYPEAGPISKRAAARRRKIQASLMEQATEAWAEFQVAARWKEGEEHMRPYMKPQEVRKTKLGKKPKRKKGKL